jgi:multidrug efflux pump subunit AcrB
VAVSKFEQKYKESGIVLPPGYEIALGGEAAERDKAVGNLLASAGTLAVLMCSTLVLGFSSFRLAGIIGAVAFSSVGLSFGALYFFGYPFGFMAIVGSMGLVGVAINDTIVVLAALLADPKASQGELEPMVGVVNGASRHVFTTTATTIAGFLPLLLSGGSFWPPLAVAVAGGVSGATVLALLFAPACFRLVRRKTQSVVETSPNEQLSSNQPE